MFKVFLKLTSLVLFVTGSSNGKTVQQTPRGLIRSKGELAEIKCSHDIQGHDRILWYKQTHNKEFSFMGYLIGTSYNSMYWFRKRPSESMELIVHYYVNMGTPEDKFKQKVLVMKKGNSLDITVKELESTDSAVYFCAKQEAQHDKLIFNLNKNFEQSPAYLLKNHAETAQFYCSYAVKNFEQILWLVFCGQWCAPVYF
ncbi:hypothetical protein Q7C36_011875 [Tachysurus vachellii]|uniref:Immunoglobulin V-set domain-containing protein n=1 Tax=Tachysurus vachellii TaxID=175792 RepID=A0AA88SLS1_TACVA|nr:hypothetical protein Q7C36_011875 [Tachysurus vachellii]